MKYLITLILLVTVFAVNAGAGEGTVKGNVVYEGMTVDFKHVYLITGPNVFKPEETVRTLIFTDADLGDKIKACDSVFCATGLVLNGMTVEFTSSPRLNYWVTANNQLMQISGTALPDESFKPKANTADHIAGVLMIDDSDVNGPKAQAEFDVTLTKSFTTHH